MNDNTEIELQFILFNSFRCGKSYKKRTMKRNFIYLTSNMIYTATNNHGKAMLA